MKRNIFIGAILGSCVPITIIFNQTILWRFNFILFVNPFSWIFFPFALLCKTEECSTLFLVIGMFFVGWIIFGGFIGFLIYKIRQRHNLKHT
jgi:hypothetical protein